MSTSCTPTIFMPAHVTVLMRPGVGLQCGVLPHHCVILPLPNHIAPGQVLQVLHLARQPIAREELARALHHCGFNMAMAEDIIGELLRAQVLQPRAKRAGPIYVLNTGVAAKHTGAALERMGIDHHVIDDPASAGAQLLLTGGEIFLPPDVHYALMTHHITHFPHGLVDGRMIMGPLVIPGATPCLACVDKQYAHMDRGWRATRIQAGAKPGPKDRFELDTAALAVATVVRDQLIPMMNSLSEGTEVPERLLQRRIIRLGTFDTVTDPSARAYTEQCPVCHMARLGSPRAAVEPRKRNLSPA